MAYELVGVGTRRVMFCFGEMLPVKLMTFSGAELLDSNEVSRAGT